jgi:hypothetical protein
MVKTSLGNAIAVPIRYQNPIALQAEGETTLTELQKTSYLLIYKDNNQSMQAEWVSLAPMGEKKNDKFVGIVDIKTWDGEFKRGFAFGQNGEVTPLQLNNITYRPASYNQPIFCISVNTYETVSAAGYGILNVRSFTSTYCFMLDGGGNNDRPAHNPGGSSDEPFYEDDGGGGPGPGDYTKILDCAGVPGGKAKFSEECKKCIGGTTGIEKCPTKNPCDESKKLAQDTKFKQLFVNLQNKVSDNKEHGYLITKDANGKITSEIPIAGLANTAEIEFDVANKIDGYIHSHYTNLLPVFSYSDLVAMALIYKSNRMNNPQTFTAGVVTASGTQYLLFIDDEIKFKTFADEITREGVHDGFEYLYKKVFKINEKNTLE